MAGAGFREFIAGEVLTAEQVQTYLQDQSVMVFDDSAARTTALGTALAEGMVTYLKDTNAVEVWDSSAWQNINDNTNAVLKSDFSAAGQIVYSTAASAIAALPAGEVGQILQSDGTAVTWADAGGSGGSVWFNYTYSADVQSRYYYPLEPGYYWFQFFDKNGSTGPTGKAIAWDDTMSPLGTATLTSGTAYGDSLARLNLVAGTATYLTFTLDQNALVVLSNAGEAQAEDTTGTPTVVSSSQDVVITATSTVYLFGGGGSGQGRGGGNQAMPGGGSGYQTVLSGVTAGTYAAVIVRGNWRFWLRGFWWRHHLWCNWYSSRWNRWQWRCWWQWRLWRWRWNELCHKQRKFGRYWWS